MCFIIVIVRLMLTQGGSVEELYQVCYDMTDDKTRKREINSLLQGARKFRCNRLTIVTFEQEEDLTIDDYTIRIVPAVKWLLEM